MYVPVYTEEEVEVESMPSDGRITLKQVVTMMNEGFERLDAKMEAGFKQINNRLDYIVKANNLKDLPKKH